MLFAISVLSRFYFTSIILSFLCGSDGKELSCNVNPGPKTAHLYPYLIEEFRATVHVDTRPT